MPVLSSALGVLLSMAMTLGLALPDSVRPATQPVELPVLLYHDISDSGQGEAIIAYDNFVEHMNALHQAGYHTVSLEQVLAFAALGRPLPDKPLLLTFDDGYTSNYTLAFPVLRELDMQATIFAIGVHVGQTTYKDTGAPIIPHFTYDQAREMMDSGLISIQSHTYDMHQWRPLETGPGREGVLPLVGETSEAYQAALLADFTQSKRLLEENTGKPLLALAYPFGLHTQESEAACDQLDIPFTFTTIMASNRVTPGDPSCLRLLNRYSIDDMPASKLLELLERPAP